METLQIQRRRVPDGEAPKPSGKTWSILFNPEASRAVHGAIPAVSPEKVGLGRRMAQFKPIALPENDAWIKALHRHDRPSPGPALVAMRLAAQPTPESERLAKLMDQKRGALRVGDEASIAESVDSLSTDGYRSLVGDLFRREGYAVHGGEGPDSDVIDLEAVRGGKHWLINCQLRGIGLIDIAPLVEMAKVVLNNNAAGAFIIADGEFVPEALFYAQDNRLVLVDRWLLLSMVVEMALQDARKPSFAARLTKGLHPVRGHELRHMLLLGGDHKNDHKTDHKK